MFAEIESTSADMLELASFIYALTCFSILFDKLDSNVSTLLFSSLLSRVILSTKIFKLLIAEKGETTEKYIFKPLSEIIAFLQQRIQNYPKEKFGDRMFFSSMQLQMLIHSVTKN